jgi:hypothetical protein
MFRFLLKIAQQAFLARSLCGLYVQFKVRADR